MASEMVTLPAAAFPDLRRMLAIGLGSLAELERIAQSIEFSETCGRAINKELHPLHPTGALEHGDFATALMWLDQARPVDEA